MAALAGKLLKDMGYTNVHILEGRYRGLERRRLPDQRALRLANQSSDTMSGKVRYFIMAKWMSSWKHRRSPKR